MMGQKRIRDFGISIGSLKTGKLNSITDVNGITVGHCTVDNEASKTGVTVIMPSLDNMFKNKLTAACHVINGFGKSIGAIQVEELGTIETPIVLTNTLSVGTASQALVHYMLMENEDVGLTTGTVNPIVCECNDGYLNNIRNDNIREEHIFKAIQNAGVEFEEGSVGAGTGMRCFGLKGGIGTASRVVTFDNKEYHLGSLVLTNFGHLKDFNINGVRVGQTIMEINKKKTESEENGSIIVIIATDIPMNERQLKRTSKRAAVGINRTGGFVGNGSGEVVIAFSTANRISHYKENDLITISMIHENNMDTIFRAAAESVEEAILSSLVTSKTTIGRNENTAVSLIEYMNDIGPILNSR